MTAQLAETPKKRSLPSMIFSILAILAGLNAFLVAGMRGHGAGWEEMSLYTGPAVLFAVLAIVIRRGTLSFVALGFAGLAIVSFFLGA
jgi:hypothetical protein